MAKFLFILGSGLGDANSPTRCIQFAQVAHQKGHEVSIFLIDEGVVFARDGITDDVVAPTGEELALAMEYVKQEKIPLYVCTPCAKVRGVTEDVMIEGAEYALAAKLIDLALEAKVFNF
jgi:sulfur relay (sulfurtransferase) complex TusBCD TusD component (DsrE family)